MSINSSKLKAEIAKRAKAAANKKQFKIEDFCFDKQIAFINDPARFKTAVCSRRAGKSIACAADLIHTALHKKGDVAYLTLSRVSAKRIIWRELLKINKEFDIGGIPDNTDLSLKMPDGNIIYVSGAKDATDAERWRGMAFSKVYIDEAQSFRSYIADLIEDILEPALTDYNGSLSLIGTPGPVPAGYFFDASHNSEWGHHAWTMQQNPHIKLKSGREPLDIIQELAKRRGLTTNDASIQREYFGQWIKDLDSLVFKFDAVLNTTFSIPENLTYIFGIDIGYKDADSISVLGYSHFTGEIYLVEEIITNKQDITGLVTQIKTLQAKYKPVKMVMDAGALGKKIQEEIRMRHQLPIDAADKARKFEYIAMLNDDLRSGRFKALPNSRFAEDCNLVQWNYDDPARPKISDVYHSDSCFVKGTAVHTNLGIVNIEDINNDHLILTRDGYKPINWAAKTGQNKSVLKLTFSDGNSITCTEHHPIYTQNRGFVAASDLTSLDRCVSICEWEKTSKNTSLDKQLFFKEQSFIGTHNLLGSILNHISPGTLIISAVCYIGPFGNIIMDQFQKVLLFTTKTMTSLIMIYPIYNAYLLKSIMENMVGRLLIKIGQKTCLKQEKLRKLGTVVQKVFCGIKSTLNLGKKKIESLLLKHAQCVLKYTPEMLLALLKKVNLYVHKNVFQRLEGNLVLITKQEHATSVKPNTLLINIQNKNFAVGLVTREILTKKEDVYNISVKDTPEYFANNILVHNCDSTLYAWREGRHYFKQSPAEKIAINTDKYMDMLEQKEMEKFEQRKSGMQEFTDVVDFDDIGVKDDEF